jgi:hypothetical protein
MCLEIFSYSHLTIIIIRTLAVTAFARNKSFRLADITGGEWRNIQQAEGRNLQAL